MKSLFISLMLITTTFTILTACTKEAQASDLYLTTSAGYQWAQSNTEKHQEQAFGYSQDDHGLVGAAIGTQIDTNLFTQIEYNNIKASGNNATNVTTQQNINLVGIVPIFNLAKSTDIYVLGGAGYTWLKGDNVQREESATALLGAGLKYVINPSVNLISEVRTSYDVNHNYWQPSATVGVNVNLTKIMNSISIN